MKRIGYLYEKICDMDNLRLAHQHAKKGKGWYKEVVEVEKDLDAYLLKLQDMLINHTYKTSEYEVFYKSDSGKKRKIYKLPYFPDRIAQWAIMQVIEPYLLRNFIRDTYSAIPGRGIHICAEKIKKIMRNDKTGSQYCLKLDVRHYYQSINHDILKQKYRKLFKDKELLWILDEIIDSINTAEADDLNAIYPDSEHAPTGIPIGNYISQYSGNFYLSDFDHWIKEEKRIKYYYRYMDDIVILDDSKEKLHILEREIEKYLYNNLRLVVKDNWQIFPTYIRGIDFIGYRFFDNHVLLRKGTYKRFCLKMQKIKEKTSKGLVMNYSEWCSIASYKGWIKHCDGYGLLRKYIKPLSEAISTYLKLKGAENGKVRYHTEFRAAA